MKNLLVTVALLVASANIYGANKFLLGDPVGKAWYAGPVDIYLGPK